MQNLSVLKQLKTARNIKAEAVITLIKFKIKQTHKRSRSSIPERLAVALSP